MSVQYQSFAYNSAGGTPATLTIPLPSGAAANEYWGLQVLYTDASSVATVTPSDGQIGTAQLTTENVGQACFYRKITAADVIAGNVVVAFGAPLPGFAEAALVRLTGVSLTTPFGPSGTSANKGNSATPTGLSVTATVGGSLLLRWEIPLGGARTVAPVGMTNAYSQDGNEFIADYESIGGGATGNIVSTQATTFGNAWAVHMAAFQPTATPDEALFFGSGTTG